MLWYYSRLVEPVQSWTETYAMLKDQTNIIDRERFKIASCCDIGTQWIKNRERRVKKGVGGNTNGYNI